MHGGLHQRGVHDGLGDPLGLRVVTGAVRRHHNQGLGALAVEGELACQIQAHGAQRGLQLGFVDRPGHTVRQHHHHIAGGGVAVHAERVERDIAHAAQHRVEPIGSDLGIGSDHRDHCGHVGLDHSRALGNAHHGRCSVAGGDRHTGGLGMCVGRHDRGRRGHCIARPHSARGARIVRARLDRHGARPQGNLGCLVMASDQPVEIGIHLAFGIGHADQAGGAHQDVVGLADQQFRYTSCQVGGVSLTLIPGRHVGVLRHDHHGTRPTVGHVGLAETHARTGEQALGEHSRRCGRVVGREHHHIVGVVLDADVADMAAEARRQLHRCRPIPGPC